MYYYANADKTREEIKRLVSKGQWKTNDFPDMKQALLEKLNIQDIDENKADLHQTLEEMKQNLLKELNVQNVNEAKTDLHQELKEELKETKAYLQQVLKEIQELKEMQKSNY
ncbi:hypothetical protein C1645_168418 [Glomus cerebriforme]|uniref:Uncharacterized protein n=1 Tax=Glomus cerebriforme TaxID=658196 RepID=A0A397T195_9GLOM|nr:hypothetical protein C1645_168418 [Glomus cerebriforme]